MPTFEQIMVAMMRANHQSWLAEKAEAAHEESPSPEVSNDDSVDGTT